MRRKRMHGRRRKRSSSSPVKFLGIKAISNLLGKSGESAANDNLEKAKLKMEGAGDLDHKHKSTGEEVGESDAVKSANDKPGDEKGAGGPSWADRTFKGSKTKDSLLEQLSGNSNSSQQNETGNTGESWADRTFN